MARYDNVFLSDTENVYSFSSTPKPGGKPIIPTRANRQLHSDNLIAQFQEAQSQFRNYTPHNIELIFNKDKHSKVSVKSGKIVPLI